MRRSEKKWSPYFRLRCDNYINALSIKDILVFFLNALHGMWNQFPDQGQGFESTPRAPARPQWKYGVTSREVLLVHLVGFLQSVYSYDYIVKTDLWYYICVSPQNSKNG